MSELAVLVPVLARPHRVKPLLESIRAATPDARVLFVLDAGDDGEEQALNEAVPGQAIQPFRSSGQLGPLRVDALVSTGSYAEKISAGVRETTEPLLFLAADDLEFKPGWFDAAQACLTDGVEVVGVNDLLTRSREHATHFLMTRAYAERPTVDGKPGPLFDGYSHWFCDDELIATATKRGAYAYCPEAVVEHLHPSAGTAPDDATYERGRAKRWTDAQLFKRRRKLWR